ncbi:hypothetical protein [Maritalea sp.]|uniref:hypothetical protein n=1 Tax=Maritalea sp. TaxID=2003361 RepID=UPI003EF6D997
MTTMKPKYIAIAIASCLIASCSSDTEETSTTEESDSTFLEGRFIDSPVSGLDYATATNTGTTDVNGSFSYTAGETIQFRIGELFFPTVMTSDIITPIEMAVGGTYSEALGTNVARLLQSLDEDADTSNGIQIPVEAALVASAVNFDVPIEEFAANPDVINLVANSGSDSTSLIPADTATAHLLATLADLTNETTEDTGEGIAGYWGAAEAGDYIQIEQNGAITFYDFQELDSCYVVRTGTVTQVEGALYNVETDDGISQQVVITRNGDMLNILLVGSLVLTTDSGPAELSICS